MEFYMWGALLILFAVFMVARKEVKARAQHKEDREVLRNARRELFKGQQMKGLDMLLALEYMLERNIISIDEYTELYNKILPYLE